MNWVRDNLLTLTGVVIAMTITVILAIPEGIAFSLWSIAFFIDCIYTYNNRRYASKYELNVIVRRSIDNNTNNTNNYSNSIIVAFIKVLLIEFALISMLAIILSTIATLAISVVFVVFAVIHTSAFIRSYRFLKLKRSK